MWTTRTPRFAINAFSVLNGRVGLCACPGRKEPGHVGGGALDADILAIRQWRADIVLSLLEPREFALLGVASLPGKMRASFDWQHLPIPDMQPPDAGFERAWRECAPRLVRCLSDGGRVLVHCRGGLGRSGTVAARILIDQGVPADRAMARVRAVRPGAIETRRQEAYLLRLAPMSDAR